MGSNYSVPDIPIDFGIEIDRFQCKYIGSVPVGAAKGVDVCETAVARILELGAAARTVDVRVTTTGIYLIDARTGDIVKEVEIKEVSYVQQGSTDKKLVSFFENDEKIRVITCHTFRVPKEGHLIPVAIGQAFKVMTGQAEAPQQDGGKKKKLSKSESKQLSAMENTSAAFQVGEEVEVFEGWSFCGVVNVSEAKGNAVVEEALERINKQKKISATITIYENAICITNSKSKDDLLTTTLSIISFYHMTEDKTQLSFISNDKRLDKIQCASFFLEGGNTDESLRKSIMAAQKKMIQRLRAEAQAKKQEREAKSGKPSVPADDEQEESTGKIIGVFEASYLGVASVSKGNSAEAVESAVAAVQKQKNIPVGVFVQVGTEGVRLIDSLTHEVTSSYILKNVTYSTVAGKRKDLFAFISRDDTLNLNNCLIFQCVGERAFDLATSLGAAFKAFKEEQDRIGTDPFAAHGKVRETPDELKNMDLERSCLVAKKAIGAGQFGQVYLAEQKEDGEVIPRAVKMLRGGASKGDREEFVQESSVMTELQHESLVGLVGVSMAQRPWLMVLEFLKYGDLRGVLRGCDAVGIQLEAHECLNFCVQIARGMQFMASKNLLHMDLAARNCLLDAGNVVKVADFGLTRKVPAGQDYWQSEAVMKLPIKWCAIESLDERIFSEGSDVWAFGVVLWEIYSYGVTPYEDLKSQEVQRRVREGHRLAKPENCPKEVYALAKSCWRAKRQDRPTFSNLQAELGTYLRNSNNGSSRDVGASLREATAQS